MMTDQMLKVQNSYIYIYIYIYCIYYALISLVMLNHTRMILKCEVTKHNLPTFITRLKSVDQARSKPRLLSSKAASICLPSYYLTFVYCQLYFFKLLIFILIYPIMNLNNVSMFNVLVT